MTECNRKKQLLGKSIRIQPVCQARPGENDGSGFSVLCGKLPSQPWDGAGGHGESSCIEARPAIGYAYGVGGEKFDNRKEGREG